MSIKQQVTKLQHVVKLRNEAMQYEKKIADNSVINNRLGSISGPLGEQVKRVTLMTSLDQFGGVAIKLEDSLLRQAQNSKLVLSEFRELWDEKNFGALQDNRLSNAEQSIKALVAQLEEITQHAYMYWKQDFEGKFDVDDTTLDQQKHFPDKLPIQKEYIDTKSFFYTVEQEFTWTEGELQKLFKLAQTLVELSAQMNREHLPEDVKQFLNAVKAPTVRSTLRYLTPEVLEWLKQHQMLDKFVVS
ncbi:TPA: hypothetical protein NKQ52_004680 [Vibrio parahaemolyticus]|nr:hypothetical protein [Vibrio parahaemolyticus]MDF4873604.1 hypothetical protein [Vibrio parahaemolyticus]HCG8583601.1 hypothetical protein [Vibrio parahaemolyticus]HCG9752873.1 hypothetical protein [Vibrio parahaemolyticus]HCH1656968.1 hypothetical protein [Vibrio parahaemolyticus]